MAPGRPHGERGGSHPQKGQRSDAAAAALADKIYVVGGFNGHSQLRSVERLNLRTGRWKRARPMGTARAGVAAAVLGGRLYAVGGWDGERRLQSGEVYNPRTNQWTPIPDMITPRYRAPTSSYSRSNFALVVAAGRLTAVGGYDGQGATSLVEELHPTLGWVATAPLPTPRSALSCLSLPLPAFSSLLDTDVAAQGGHAMEGEEEQERGIIDISDSSDDEEGGMESEEDIVEEIVAEG